MCFSAGASFGASALLVVAGAAAVTAAKTTPQRMLSAIPFIFAVQQGLEGMLWLSINHTWPRGVGELLTYSYLVIAMAIWPVWIPLAIRQFEEHGKRKRMLDILVGTGVLVAAVIITILATFPVTLMSIDHHLHYRIGLPDRMRSFIWMFTILYCAATIVPAFISGTKRMVWLGIGFALAYCFTLIWYPGSVVSVWCYFAAILSVVVVWILRRPKVVSPGP
jgi:hypothetical protein